MNPVYLYSVTVLLLFSVQSLKAESLTTLSYCAGYYTGFGTYVQMILHDRNEQQRQTNLGAWYSKQAERLGTKKTERDIQFAFGNNKIQEHIRAHIRSGAGGETQVTAQMSACSQHVMRVLPDTKQCFTRVKDMWGFDPSKCTLPKIPIVEIEFFNDKGVKFEE